MKTFWRLIWWSVLIGGAVMLIRKLRQAAQEREQLPVSSGPARPAPGMPTTVGGAGAQPEAAPAAAPAADMPMPDVLGSDVQAETGPAADKDTPDEPPPPPSPPPLVLSTRSLEGVVGTEQARSLWLALQQETCRHRGKGFRPDWAFPQYAARYSLGAPLAPTTRISIADKRYVFQPFARGTLFNEIPLWSEVQNLNDLLNGQIPGSGLARELLDASFGAGGALLESDWAFHNMAVREQLGPPLMESRRVKVGRKEYSTQVFAADTLYCEVPNWQDVKRLSEAPAGKLADALWEQTYIPCGVPYDPASPAQQFAAREKLGAPLSGLYQIDFEGHRFDTQVFAVDTILADPGGEFMQQSTLDRPDRFKELVAPDLVTVINTPDSDTRDDALSDKRPMFGMLPVAGQPRISQFYGYTQWAAGSGRNYYGQCQGRHPGIDFAVPVGTPLLSVGHGVVVYAGPSSQAPFGGAPPQIAIVRYGNLYVIYGHSSAMQVSKGQRVTPGQVVTLSGDYGGPHLHFEVRPVPESMLHNSDPNQAGVNPGYTVNPLDYFSEEMNAYFERWYNELGGESHFCRGGLRDQERITFAGPVDTRPCTS